MEKAQACAARGGVEDPDVPRVRVQWLESKKAGLLGDRPIGPHTEADYRSRLVNHILPFFGEYRINEITTEDCLDFKAHKLKESAELHRSIDAGAELRDRCGRRVRPLGPATLRKLCMPYLDPGRGSVRWLSAAQSGADSPHADQGA